jgi:tetratricopeptide (TPR) repeat protein
VVLVGDAGIGKSRLARAICRSTQKHGGRRFEFDCTESAALTPLYPVATVLRRSVSQGNRTESVRAREARLHTLLERELGSAGAEDTARYLWPLAGFEAPDTTASAESPELTRQRVIEKLVDLVKAFAKDSPLVLLFEDIHWADRTTKDLLLRLADRENVPVSKILIIATARLVSKEDRSDLESRSATLVQIEPLDPESARKLVRLTPGGGSLSNDVVERIVETAERNPLLLEELARAAIEQPGAAPASDSKAHEELQRTVTARLDRNPELKPIVQAASVLGREFQAQLLRDLVTDKALQVSSAIRRLVELGLLTDPPSADPERVRFKHALIRDDVYATIVLDEKRRLHSAVADLLSDRPDGIAGAAQAVRAHHLEEAARFTEAARALIAATDIAASRAAYEEAEGHCRKGLDLAARVDAAAVQTELKLELLTQLGVILSAKSGYATEEVQQAYQQARALSEVGASPAVLFRIVRGLGAFYFVRGELENAADMSASCLSLAHQSGRPEFLIEALSFRGYPCVYRGQLTEGRAALEECLSLYDRHDGERLKYPSPQDAATAAWSLLGIARWLLGDATGAESAVDGALDHLERSNRLGRKFDAAYLHVWIAMLRNMQRRFDEAAAHAEQCITLSEKYGFRIWHQAARMHACIAKASREASLDAIGTLYSVLQEFSAAGARANASFFLCGVATGLRVLGQREQAKQTIDMARGLADATGESYLTSELLMLDAELEIDDTRARARLYEALAIADVQNEAILSLRAALEILRRDGRSSANPELDRQAREALEGKTPYPTLPNWPVVALEFARRALSPMSATDAAL